MYMRIILLFSIITTDLDTCGCCKDGWFRRPYTTYVFKLFDYKPRNCMDSIRACEYHNASLAPMGLYNKGNTFERYIQRHKPYIKESGEALWTINPLTHSRCFDVKQNNACWSYNLETQSAETVYCFSHRPFVCQKHSPTTDTNICDIEGPPANPPTSKTNVRRFADDKNTEETTTHAQQETMETESHFVTVVVVVTVGVVTVLLASLLVLYLIYRPRGGSKPVYQDKPLSFEMCNQHDCMQASRVQLYSDGSGYADFIFVHSLKEKEVGATDSPVETCPIKSHDPDRSSNSTNGSEKGYAQAVGGDDIWSSETIVTRNVTSKSKKTVFDTEKVTFPVYF